MPGGSVFVDTNVLLYFHDRRNPDKQEQVAIWLDWLADRHSARTNLQVLNELTYVLLRKKWFDKAATVFSIVEQFAAFGQRPVSIVEVERARWIHLRYAYSWWDCLLLASALELGCSHFLSEDLQDGHRIESLTIIDPFAHSPDQILALR